VKRRLTVTLAWLTPINPRHHKYRRAELRFNAPESPLAASRLEADYRAVQRGTLQHEVFEGARASAFVDGSAIRIEVNCRAGAGVLAGRVRYALVVTLEVGEGVEIPIYEEIRQRIRVPVAVPVR
jgi:hypothetical protein